MPASLQFANSKGTGLPDGVEPDDATGPAALRSPVGGHKTGPEPEPLHLIGATVRFCSDPALSAG
jgi:hypothetical protein